jgi:hypothetical protein
VSELPEAIHAVPPHITAERRVILGWLQERAPSLAELYDSALWLMHDRPLRARVRLVAHCVREIVNRLPEAVAAATVTKRVDYRVLVERIAAVWPPADPALLVTETPDVPAEVMIPRAAYVAVNALTTEHAQSQPFELKLRALFDVGDGSATALTQPAVRAFKKVYDWFVARSHDRLEIDEVLCTEEELQLNFAAFERALYTLTGEWLEVQEQVDELLDEANRRTD